MCDQTEVSYLDGDVVWVKMGPVWWPGVVADLEKTDEGKEILAGLRKKPIASVKFFNEDNYEYVKNLDHIYHYNCRRKDEFIKKGLDKYRTGTDFMKKFPVDVTTAESLVNGDINIINDPKFLPEEKQNYNEIFGSGKKKKKKDSEILPKAKGRPSSSTVSTPSYRPITHQRFINKALHGESDHKVKTLIQPSASPEDSSANKYKCHVCKFETTRVNVIVAHNRLSHSSNQAVTWAGSDSKLVRRKPTYKSRKPKSKKLFDSFDEEEFNDVSYEEPKKKRSPAKTKASKDKSETKATASPTKSTTSSPGKRKAKDEVMEAGDQKKPRFTDALLADWSEDEDDEKGKMDIADNDEVGESSEAKSKEKEEDETKIEDGSLIEAEHPAKVPTDKTKNQSKKMSCFDFDEEEEGFIGMSNANTYGRKIPRVIPVKDKSDLGVDLEIEELFKRKSESDHEDVRNENGSGDDKNATDDADGDLKNDNEGEDGDKASDADQKPATRRRGRKPKGKSKEKKTPEPPKVEDSLAMRRGRRPGARKSYLNEVIEKVEEEGSPATAVKKDFDQPDLDFSDQEIQSARVEVRRSTREEGSSRRKQDLKIHARGEFSDIIKPDPKSKAETTEKRGRKRSSEKSQSESEDLTKEIDKLLTETNVPALPTALDKKGDSNLTEEPTSNTLNFSFDYVPSEQPPKKILAKQEKGKQEVKSISKMFSDSIITTQDQENNAVESKNVAESSSSQKEGSTSAFLQTTVKAVTSPLSSPKKKVILSSIPKIVESSGGHVTVLPIVKTTSATSEGNCVILSSGKKVDLKKVITEVKQESSDGGEGGARMKTIKTFKIKPESLPPSLLAGGKLKPGHTIIQQKGGKYVIVSPQSHAGQSKLSPGKPVTPNKVVIVTNQHGEQKIITTGGLKPSKLTQKILTSTDTADKSDSTASASGLTAVSKAQPIIKMVPDGKGGVMKTLSVSPKKVLLGGTKVLVSPSSSPQKETIQKIAMPAGSGDLRLIENFKGSGKTFIIQGSSGSGNVILKPSSTPRQAVSRVSIQSPQKILSLKKNPKIVMRTSSGQSEFVVHSAGSTESSTYVVKKQGPDGKFATQKIIRRPIVQTKPSTSGVGSKTIFLSSGQVSTQKGESIIIKSNQEPVTNIVRLKPVAKDQEAASAKPVQKIVQKSSEIYSLPQNSYVLPAETVNEQTTGVAQTIQVQEQAQQHVLQTQVVAMPGPIGADGNQTYVLVSVDEHGVVQPVDNSIIAYDISTPQDQVYVNPANTNNVILINNQPQEELTPVYSTASQDILAEALANTNVLDGSISTEMESVMPSILLPPAIPSSVVQETSITLQKPIMTPLEMPSSVQPDTSGLQPPPLPPTPTEEDVLMEEPEGNLNVSTEGEIMQDNPTEESQIVTQEGELCTNVITTKTFTVSGNDQTDNTSEQTYQETVYQEENKTDNFDSNGAEETYVTEEEIAVDQSNVVKYYQADDYQEVKQQENVTPREDFIIENSQEDQGANSFQSMPLLNDEPDTSDDAQGSEPIADQDFELQKSRMGNGDFSPLLREQEPPSSTNNDIVTESNYESSEGSQGYQEKSAENTYREDENSQDDENKEKESSDNKDTQSMPVITDEGNINTYEIEPIYTDVINQKRFQEETEVTSTTDEFANKGNVV